MRRRPCVAIATALLAAGAAAWVNGCRSGRAIEKPTPPETRLTIGVLLPLSGKMKAFGAGGRDAVRLAIGELDRPPSSELRVVVRDSKGDAEGAAQAVEALVEMDGAIAIVGPLFRSEATAAAEKAQDLGVPLLAVTADREVTEVGRYVFRAGISPEDELDALVAHATDTLKLKRFAVLYPTIEYGERMFQLFKERVESRGATLEGVETYAPEDTTFTEPIRRLVQRDALSKRSDVRRAIRKCQEAPDSYRRARCEKEARQKAPPVIAFDAVFIPDSARQIALIAPALAAEDIIVERDRGRLAEIEKALGRKVRPVTLLGTSLWNTPELLRKAGRSVENAIFPGVTFDASGDEATRVMIAGFRKHFGRRPEVYEALLYDATRFMRQVLTGATFATTVPFETTDDLRAQMHEVRDFEGVAGAISFADGTDAHRPLRVLTVKNQVIQAAAR
ncbi:MAG: penicillin-binding protein activator [Deltaproteobacteria bacterium]|nr:penicillin-binding protein activator [Deltaproteobacteria bacterium]